MNEGNPILLGSAETDTIDYVVTDAAGLTSTSTRTVLIEAPSAKLPPPLTTTLKIPTRGRVHPRGL